MTIDLADEIYQSEDEPENIFDNLTNVPVQMPSLSPEAAVRSIVISCLQEMQPTPPVVNKRARSERRLGKEITASGLLQELKDKKAAKGTQLRPPRRT